MYSEEKVLDDLKNRGFDVTHVKRFGPKDRPFPISLVILKMDETVKKIYDITNLFFITIKGEHYRQTHCFACQRFGMHSKLRKYP